MAQHDMIIANDTGANVRSDLNNALAAIASNNSGATEPSTTYAFQWWYDTTNSVLKLRNSANSAWITLPFSTTASSTVDINGGNIDGTTIGGSTPAAGSFSTINAADGTEAAPSITNTGDTNTGFYFPAADTIGFVEGGSEAMRIDSSGNLLVGTTTSPLSLIASSTEEGAAIGSDGLVVFSNDGQTPLGLNRLSTDGNILAIRKDGSTVGNIGSSAGGEVLYMCGGSAGGFGVAKNTNSIYPVNSSGTITDNLESIGTSSYRFKNLYLSGGVYLGGTGSANYLDDYETGTWTPTYTDQSGSTFTGTYTNREGTYTKIGNRVFVQFYLNSTTPTSGLTSGSNFAISGLPFNASGASGVAESAGNLQIAFNGMTYPTGYTQISAMISSNLIRFRLTGSGKTYHNVEVSNITGNGQVIGFISYQTS